ncbi:hypothetical protein FHS31_002883 [Sphingomonas vulcanisoli]|uniref:Rieske domain-containing protein n=1 Tax=Sphingomonas vulcanisoli TaxID=1658060 RepID=A0ABX0U057_9SPHN|nr:SRPBCC family protein [Sphingomonas vulcanisoli]NIJ09251.1 hypothetical protein [Sphingomonas vulcanisoli]
MPYFDGTTGLLDRSVFISEEIYEEEQRTIFRRCWLFVGPANWIDKTGAYFVSSMGETPILVWRGADDEPRIFVNQCVAGDGAIARRERGIADYLACSCHGLSYGREGIVTGQAHLHAVAVPRVAIYKGLIFASFDPNAAPLTAYLGDFAWYLDMLVDRREGGVEACGHAAFRWEVDANWKVPAETYAGDAYCESTLHAATNMATGSLSPSNLDQGLQISAGSGAMAVLTDPTLYQPSAVVSAYEQSVADEVEARLGRDRARAMIPLVGTLFPNLSFDWRTRSLHVWHPRGPTRTEINTYCFADAAAPDEVKDAMRRSCQLHFGPAGLRSADQVEPWSSLTKRSGSLLAARTALNFQMGMGHELKRNLPGRVSDLFSEMNQRHFFEWWESRLTDEREPIAAIAQSMRIAPPYVAD